MCRLLYFIDMTTTVRYTDEFAAWWDSLDAAAQEDVAFVAGLLEEHGAALRMPYSKKLVLAKRYQSLMADGIKHPVNMHELRVQSQGRPLRILYVFDPRRNAPLLLGGDKTGLTDERFYRTAIPKAHRVYGEYLKETTHGFHDEEDHE